ncbi:hypothetical protein Cgig2_017946 [Carnegiea gigantea]|uniref:Uncharacterized protein n=1 Tax=Carnegiea gigantea TaxID=171969 RepID=A0A9Q1KA99_9CARY|nr:hypothetical protein Cgig2_017946 [Carnegiea gigantea]
MCEYWLGTSEERETKTSCRNLKNMLDSTSSKSLHYWRPILVGCGLTRYVGKVDMTAGIIVKQMGFKEYNKDEKRVGSLLPFTPARTNKIEKSCGQRFSATELRSSNPCCLGVTVMKPLAWRKGIMGDMTIAPVLKMLSTALTTWNTEVFGNLFRRKRKL